MQEYEQLLDQYGVEDNTNENANGVVIWEIATPRDQPGAKVHVIISSETLLDCLSNRVHCPGSSLNDSTTPRANCVLLSKTAPRRFHQRAAAGVEQYRLSMIEYFVLMTMYLQVEDLYEKPINVRGVPPHQSRDRLAYHCVKLIAVDAESRSLILHTHTCIIRRETDVIQHQKLGLT